MKIKFSRHARRRARLYKIPESIVLDILENMEVSQEGERNARVYYDNKVDALYIKLGNKVPEGVIEISEGVNLDTTSEGKIVGIEILGSLPFKCC